MTYMNTITGEIIDEERFDELVDEEMEISNNFLLKRGRKIV